MWHRRHSKDHEQEPSSDERQHDVHRSLNTYLEDAGYQQGWGGMADAPIIIAESDQLAREMNPGTSGSGRTA